MKPSQNLIKEYESLKLDFEKALDSETLRKYRILSKAYKIGKKINGTRFSIRQLSFDFNCPMSTCKRVLSLDRANRNTWQLIKEKKITAFKAAMVLATKDTTFQDEVINMVIKDNTYKDIQ